ncbi:hypothetical protein DNH61_21230 [Paenibacillus sambharensis]|uniref:Uncharacterized protein n=1 Tax=Paenibacillus sambharensis TaxID=1803190 RepID=A0A2W1LG71_9BACL|nr:hypothetical protein [Paenibacillus sambharensis]PZD94005.1 hypothetical protein DNH61_21230 [Paenibacillus sambharensis]
MTTAFKVAWFEFLYQVKSKFFILGMLVMLAFLWNEFAPYIMHLPIDDDEDIRQLRTAGVHNDMLFVEVSPEQTLAAVIEHMESYSLSAENDLAARELAAEEKNQGLSLQEADRLIRERYPSFVPQWEIFVEEQGHRLGTGEEIVPVFRSYYGEH